PAGDFPASGNIVVNDYNASGPIRANALVGAGKDQTILRTPSGVTGVGIYSASTSAVVAVRDLQIVGNAGDQRFGLNWQTSAIPWGYGPDGVMAFHYGFSLGPGVSETDVPQAWAYAGGVLLQYCRGTEVHNVKAVNCFTHAVATSLCDNCWVRNCDCSMTNTLQVYLSWQFQQADSSNGGFVDCSLNAAKTCSGFESFKSVNIAFTRILSVNGLFAMNGSEAWVL